MRSSLDIPDLPDWHVLPDYSYKVASRLARAYAWLADDANLVSDYLRAANEVTPSLAKRMAPPQRLRAYYVEARAYAADGQHEAAVEWTERALSLAFALDDRSALAALLYLHGALNAALLRYSEGADDYDDSRALVRERTANEGVLDTPSDLHLTILQANLRFFMGQYAAAEALVDEATSLVPLCPNQRRECATIAWVEANLCRWRGTPELALRPALAAAEVYTAGGPANSAARVQTVAADAAFDLAATFPHGSDRDALLQMARPHVTKALQLASGVDDQTGSVLAGLTEMRGSRLAGSDEDRLAILEGLAQDAKLLGDEALMAQAFTAMGDELADRREVESARHCYRQTLGLLDGSDLRAIGAWAWRALHREDGMISHTW